MTERLRLVTPDDPILRRRCQPVVHISEFMETAFYMDELREKWCGLGLAAPQVGIGKRFFVTHNRIVFNPKVLKQSKEFHVEEEGCLSLPETLVPVYRPVWVEVQYTDEETGHHEETLWHMDARVFLHELDHLNGKLITDYL